jgi:hypothetical protein
MKKFPAWVLLACIINLYLVGTANSAVMAIWNFGPDGAGYTENVFAEYVNGIPTLSVIGGDKDTNGKDGVSYVDSNGTSHSDGQAAAWNDASVPAPDPDASWTMTIDTTGWQDISIRWDYLSENDAAGGDLGPASFDFSYRIGSSGTWIKELPNEQMIRDDLWHEFSFDFALNGITAIEDQSFVQFMVDDLENDETGGKFRFDNLEVTGNAIPEPATISLLALGFLINRRRKIK